MVRKVIGAICLVFAAAGVYGSTTQSGVDATASVVISTLLAVVGLILVLKKGKSKEQKVQRKAAAQEAKEQSSRTFRGEHMAGLPIAQGTSCVVVFEDGFVSIGAAGNSFRLDFDKVTDLQMKTDVDIQKSYVSSVGGAVGGAVLFGALGAMVGGRAKEKTSRTFEYFFIITYNKDSEIAYVSFKVFDSMRIGKLIGRYKPMLTDRIVSIDL